MKPEKHTNLKEGDIISFKHLDENVTHKIWQISPDGTYWVLVSGNKVRPIFPNDIIEVVAEKRYVIENRRTIIEDGILENIRTYYNSGHYMMVGDLQYSSRYRTPFGAAKDLDYVSSQVYGGVAVVPVYQIERNYHLKLITDFHPETFELLDEE